MGCRSSKPVLSAEDVATRVAEHHKRVGAQQTFALSMVQVENLRTAFEGITNSDGLTRADFSKMFSFEEGQCDALFDIFDVDGDGTVDINEFISGFCFMCKGSATEKAALMFATNDADGNGVLDRKEVAALLEDMDVKVARLSAAANARNAQLSTSLPSGTGHPVYGEDAPATIGQLTDGLFANYDADGDGQISLDEFCEFMSKDEAARKYSMHMELLAQQVLYSGVNNPQSQKFWKDVRDTGGWDKGRPARAPPNTRIQQKRRGRRVESATGNTIGIPEG
jgi:Ca2+-binding EF-hand superfamily protein